MQGICTLANARWRSKRNGWSSLRGARSPLLPGRRAGGGGVAAGARRTGTERAAQTKRMTKFVNAAEPACARQNPPRARAA